MDAERVETLAADCKLMLAEGREMEEVLAHLRREGCGLLDSMSVLREALGIGLRDAKRFVYDSHVWDDYRQAEWEYFSRTPPEEWNP